VWGGRFENFENSKLRFTSTIVLVLPGIHAEAIIFFILEG
jgi:hypothetical protein